MTTDDVTKNDGAGKWTLGPYHRDNLTVYALRPTGDRYFPMENRWSANVQAAPGTQLSELEAVAALFEATPDMAEALHNTRVFLSAFIGPDDELGQLVLSEAAKALAKARGQS